MATTKNSFIFYADWVKTLDKIPANERLAYYEEIVQYAINGTKPTDPLHDLILTQIFAMIDQHATKYEEISERRKAAGRASAKKRYEAKAEEAREATEAAAEAAKEVKTDTTAAKPKPAPPEKTRSFMRYYNAVQAVQVPPEVTKAKGETQYVWRAAECMPAFVKAVHDKIASPGFSQSGLYDWLPELEKKYRPQAPYQALTLALKMRGLPELAIVAIAEEVDKALLRGETDIWDTMGGKVDYILNNKDNVHNIRAFIQNRVKYGT